MTQPVVHDPLRHRPKRPRADSGAAPSADGMSNGCDEYFSSYADLSVHALMLKDEPRMHAYVSALKACADQIRGKVVLDVGCGTGVLSMLCAKICEPAKVIAVEATPETAALAQALVEQNQLSSVIEVVNTPVESLQLASKVNVLVSEWMGFYLLHESMLDSVLWARDNLLKSKEEGGLLLPSKGTILCAPLDGEEEYRERVDVWSDYLGLDFTPFGLEEMRGMLRSPQVKCVNPGCLLSSPSTFASLDLWKVTSADLNKIEKENVKFKIEKQGFLAGVTFWFTCEFEGSGVILDTSPSSPPSHWMQTSLFLGCRAPVEEGEEVECRVRMERGGRRDRMYEISIET